MWHSCTQILNGSVTCLSALVDIFVSCNLIPRGQYTMLEHCILAGLKPCWRDHGGQRRPGYASGPKYLALPGLRQLHTCSDALSFALLTILSPQTRSTPPAIKRRNPGSNIFYNVPSHLAIPVTRYKYIADSSFIFLTTSTHQLYVSYQDVFCLNAHTE